MNKQAIIEELYELFQTKPVATTAQLADVVSDYIIEKYDETQKGL